MSLLEEIEKILREHIYIGYGACMCGWSRKDLDDPLQHTHVAEMIEYRMVEMFPDA